jgi:hypothetical protein
MRRAIAFALALLATLPLPSCGACLIVERQPCELTLEGGGSVSVDVHRRLYGMLETERYEPEVTLSYLLSFVAFDWIDTAVAPLIAIRCMFDPTQSIEGGPIGVLAALTPGASLSPGMRVCQDHIDDVDPQKVERLRTATGEAREQMLLEVFGDKNVRDVTFR